jgi:hypothetical protein
LKATVHFVALASTLGYILEISVPRIGGTVSIREVIDAGGAEETDAIRVE